MLQYKIYRRICKRFYKAGARYEKIAGWFYDVFIGDVIEFIIELAFLALLFLLFPNIDLDAAAFAPPDSISFPVTRAVAAGIAGNGQNKNR